MAEKPRETDMEPEKPTHLAETLELLWAWGVLSAPTLQMVARSAVADGLDNKKIMQFARIGASGQIAPLMNASIPDYWLCAITGIPVLCPCQCKQKRANT